MKKGILIFTILLSLFSFSNNKVKTFDDLNTAVSEYGKVLQELVNYASREEANLAGDNFGIYLKQVGNAAYEKKWLNIKNKLAEPYEIKANKPKMSGTNKAEIIYDVYGYDEGKLLEMLDEKMEEFVEETEEGEILVNIEQYINSVEDFLNKAKKEKVAETEMEFEKVAGKWMLKEKGNFEQ